MRLHRILAVVAMLGLATVFLGVPSMAAEKATPQEIVQKVRTAAAAMASSGDKTLAEINKKDGPWVWKDSYIVVLDGAKGMMAANAMKPQMVGKKIIGIKDKKGNTFFAQMCKVAEKPGGGWVEYWWPKPNEKKDSRKISYALKVAGTPYVVGAGFFDDAVKLETLEALTAPKK